MKCDLYLVDASRKHFVSGESRLRLIHRQNHVQEHDTLDIQLFVLFFQLPQPLQAFIFASVGQKVRYSRDLGLYRNINTKC